MSCILRIGGLDVAIDRLVAQTALKPYRVDHKGRRKSATRVHEWSAAHYLVSDRDFDDLRGQVSDAVMFLEANAAEVAALVAFPGVQEPVLNFGINGAAGVLNDWIPAQLAKLAGGLGLAIELSHYPVGESAAYGVADA